MRVVSTVAGTVFVAVLAVVALGPLVWLALGALKSTPELLRNPPTLLPGRAEWSNLSFAWSRLDLSRYLLNTVVLAAGTLLAQLVVAVTGAFAFSVIRPPGSRFWFALVLATLFVPSTIIFIPTYVTIVDVPLVHLNLVNSWWAVWLPDAASAFNLFLLKRFFDQIPAELTEAARIDGASSWQALRHVILPLSRPILAVVAIFSVIASWKAFLWPKIALPDPGKQPLSVVLSTLSQNVELKYVLAGMLIASVPPLVLFVVLQRRILGGLADTGLTR